MSRLLPSKRSSTAATLRKVAAPADSPAPSVTKESLPPNKAQDKQAIGLINKLETKLPCNSGHTLSAVEADQVMEHAVIGIVQLANANPDFIVWNLCALLENLQKRAFPDRTLPDDVLDSILFVLKTLTRVLNARWNSSAFDDSSSKSSFPSTRSSSTRSPLSSITTHAPSLLGKTPSHGSLPSQSSASSWAEPLPLIDSTARYALRVVLPLLCSDFNGGPVGGASAVRETRTLRLGARIDGSMYSWDATDWEPALASPPRLRRRIVTDIDSAVHETVEWEWEQTALPVHGASDVGLFAHGSSSTLSASSGEGLFTMYAHDYARDPALHGSYLASVSVLITKYAGRIVFNLSASNWLVVFSRVKTRLHAMSEDKEYGEPPPSSPVTKNKSFISRGNKNWWESSSKGVIEAKSTSSREDIADNAVDLRLLSVCLLDRGRLTAVLQEFLSLFGIMNSWAQDVACVAIRAAVLNWIDNFPREFEQLWQTYGVTLPNVVSSRTLEGLPARLFDMLHELSNQNVKRAAWFFPALSSLIIVSPEKFESALEAKHGATKTTKKNNFLAQLSRASMTWSASFTNSIAEHAAIAHLDIVRSAFVLSPSPSRMQEPLLRSVGKQLAQELKHVMLSPPSPCRPFYASQDAIDVNLYAYAIAAIYRFHPEQALEEVIPTCLDPQRSQAVKTTVYKAIILMIVEAPKYPWQPNLVQMFPIVTPRGRSTTVAILAGRHEIIGGISTPPAATPTCKSLVHAAFIPGLLNEIDEDLRLLVQMETLYTLEPAFWMYETTDNDHIEVQEDTKAFLEPHRDKRAKASTMMAFCAMVTRTLNVTTDSPWYGAALRYLYFTVPTAMASVPLLMFMASGIDHEFHRMGTACLHRLLKDLANGSPYLQDEQWRFSPGAVGTLPLVELALWAGLSSSQMDISTTAQRCFRLLSVVERHLSFPRPEHLTPEEFSRRCTVLEGLGDPREVIVGRVAFLKRICKHMAMMPFSSPVLELAFREYLHRWTTLTQVVDHMRLGPDTEPPRKDEQHEWQNKMCIMAAVAGYLLTEDPQTLPPPLMALLPLHLQGSVSPIEVVRQWLGDMVMLLGAETLVVREMVKDTLTNDMNMRLMPMLVEALFKELHKRLDPMSNTADASSLIFIEQLLATFNASFARINATETVFEITSGENIVLMAKYIATLPSDISTLRLRMRFCTTIDTLLSTRHTFATRFENSFRNRLVNIFASWIEEYSRQSDQRSAEYDKLSRDSHTVALKTFVRCVETMQIESPEHTSAPMQVLSRQFRRYATTLLGTLVRSKKLDSSASIKSEAILWNEALTEELVVSGIAHLLKNNIEIGLKHSLQLCYDEDFRLRVVLMKSLTRVLYFGSKIDLKRAASFNVTQLALCELVRDCEMILSAILDVCPSTDVEKMVSVILHIFHTRTSLVDLLKVLINREFAGASNPAQLFRSNTLSTRLLSAFAKQYGYAYLRNVLQDLIRKMVEVPQGFSFELDPGKLPPGEDPYENAEMLKTVVHAFIEVIANSVTILPPIFREVCHYIWNVVSEVWPEYKFSALGAFLFLRFLCPAIVAPEIVDIEIPMNDQRSSAIRRGLMLVARIIQNLANNTQFMKESYLMPLNSFLNQHVRLVQRYLFQAQTLPTMSLENDQVLGPGCDATDSHLLHRFFQTYMDKIGNKLLGQDMSPGRSRFSSGKKAWDAICTQLVEMGNALDTPDLSTVNSTEHTAFLRFMNQNQGRNTNNLSGIFASEKTLKGQAFIFTFVHVDVEILDFELLLYLVFKTITTSMSNESYFDVVFDFTGFTCRSEVPIAWLRLVLDLMPKDVHSKWRSAYLLNLDELSLAFLRKVLCIFSDLSIAHEMIPVSSVAELQEYLGQSVMSSSYPAALERQKTMTFEFVEVQIENQPLIPVRLYVGDQHLRMLRIKSQQITAEISSRIVEVIHLQEVEDIYEGGKHNVILRKSRREPSIVFISKSSDEILKCVQTAKRRAMLIKTPLLPTSEISDLSATLLAIGLLHACHQSENIRGAAYELLTANCMYMRYPLDSHIPWRGSFVPASSLAFIMNFSDRISKFAPQLSLDFVREWNVGYSITDSPQRTICLQYMSPWLRNLSSFLNPKSSYYDSSGEKVRECINSFIKITMHDVEVYPIIQRTIWTQLGKSPPEIADIVVDELVRVAMENGMGSQSCEIAADTLIAVSSIHTRAKVLNELRTLVARACNKPTRSLAETAEWKSISALSRLALVAGHSPRLATHNQLYAPEIAHLVTMLAGTGSLIMRTSIYGMSVNLLQALHAARAEDEAIAVQIRLMLDDLSSSESLTLFGLIRRYPSSEINVVQPLSDHISVESLEKITQILQRALDLGAATTGLRNVWEARWMSLVTATAFQASFHSQSRAFSIFGHLAGSAVDDDIFYQMLVALRKHLVTSQDEKDMAAAVSMLRCMRKAVPGLPIDSRYLGFVFWLAVSLVQTGNNSCYADAVQLLQATIETMDGHNFFNSTSSATLNPVESTLLDIRSMLGETTSRLDEVSGISFDTHFGFALVAALWRGVRVRTDIVLVNKALRSLSRIAVRAANPRGEGRPQLDRLTTPLYMALSPCLRGEDYSRLLESDFYVLKSLWEEVNGSMQDGHDTFNFSLSVLQVPDVNAVLLAIALMLALDDSYTLHTQEKENVHLFSAQFAKYHPDLFASGVFHFAEMTGKEITHKLEALFSVSSSPAHLEAVTCCYNIVMARATTDSIPLISTSFIGLESGSSPQSQTENVFTQLLTEIGMIGSVQRLRAPSGTKLDPQRLQAIQCIPALLELIVAQ